MCKSNLKEWTWKEIRNSVPQEFSTSAVKDGNCLCVINNKVYNLSGDFLDWHPGGGVAISQIGCDASGAFQGFHGDKAIKMLSKFYVGELAPSQLVKPSAWQLEMQELIRNFVKQGLFESSKLFYFAKIVQSMLICLLGVAIIFYYPNRLDSVVLSSFFFGLGWQQLGWLTHDFLHHQVFSNRTLNNAMGYFLGDFLQGFSVGWWKQKHCTHHAAPNVHTQDPDIDTMPLLAWSEHALELFSDLSDDAVAKFMINYQFILIFPLLAFARFAWTFQSVLWNFTSNKTREFPTEKRIEQVCLVLHYTWLFSLAFNILSPVYAVLWYVFSQFFCGVFLSAVFTLNHSGMPVYSFEESNKIDFYELAIRTGRNVEPTAFNRWFTGGLNYQIEHHMFPTMPRHKLVYATGPIREICKKHGVKYHETSFSTGLYEVVQRLYGLAKLANSGKKAQ